jgi:ribosomal protein RSM22 (predicted rRNA methylase)
MIFPPALTAALDRLLDGVSRKDLAARALAQSDGYRAGQSSGGIVSAADALAYAVARMPATFAACAAVFARIAEVLPGFAPASLLDVGAGPGTAAWAARQQWPDLATLTLLDRNPALRALAQTLAEAGGIEARIIAGDLGAAMPATDLVIASYVLAEQPQSAAAAIAADLWRDAGMLVLIEPGTPAGFARIRAARAALIDAGAHVVAPCTHGNACPMPRSEGASRSDNQTKVDDWCHFSQRLARSREHMALKGATVPFEDERYAYLAVTREPVPHASARILAPPLETKPGLTFKLCDGDGLHAQFVPARDRDEMRRVRRKGWGDLF